VMSTRLKCRLTHSDLISLTLKSHKRRRFDKRQYFLLIFWLRRLVRPCGFRLFRKVFDGLRLHQQCQECQIAYCNP
jgi:hypothetical protein